MGSLRSLFINHTQRERLTLQFFDVKITPDDHVKCDPDNENKRTGTYIWRQGELKFDLDILADEERLYIKIGIHYNEEVPRHGAVQHYIRYAKELRDIGTKHSFDLEWEERGTPASWGIEKQGIFAVIRQHPDFPDGWSIETKTNYV
jgi:hypothetical protein